ncbi:MAG: hypothetical protein H6643_13025 [Caldilineaceae bacterium]|nr:hypothetical protein [Caldilineaceae bacterium]
MQNDILKEYTHAAPISSRPPSMRLITDIFRYCATDAQVNTISIMATTSGEAAAPRCRSGLRWRTA